MTNRLLNSLISKIQASSPALRNASPVAILTQLSEVPYHAVNKALTQFKGAEGIKNLGHGLMLGGGLSGAAAGTDYLSNGQVDNKGLAAGLGLLGAIAPATFRGGRAGMASARQFIRDVKSLGLKGVSTMSESEKNLKASIIYDWLKNKDSIVNNPLANAGNLFKKDFRDQVRSVLKPSKTVSIDYLTNETGGLNSIIPELASMASRFGKTEVAAGTIINPNIARSLSSKKDAAGLFQKVLSDMGYKRFYGNTRPTKNIGPELNSALKRRFEFVIDRGTPADAGMRVKNKSFFPFRVETASGDKIKMTTGRRANAGTYAGDFNPTFGWRDLTPAQRTWFKQQNIKGPRDYIELVNQVKAFHSHVRNAAKKNPSGLGSDFKLPSLRTIFKSEKPFNFDYNLATVAPSIAQYR